MATMGMTGAGRRCHSPSGAGVGPRVSLASCRFLAGWGGGRVHAHWPLSRPGQARRHTCPTGRACRGRPRQPLPTAPDSLLVVRQETRLGPHAAPVMGDGGRPACAPAHAPACPQAFLRFWALPSTGRPAAHPAPALHSAGPCTRALRPAGGPIHAPSECSGVSAEALSRRTGTGRRGASSRGRMALGSDS